MTPFRNVALMCPATTKADVGTHTSVFQPMYEDRGERAVVSVVGSGAARVVSGRRAAARPFTGLRLGLGDRRADDAEPVAGGELRASA